MPIAIKGQYVFRGKAVKGDSIPVGITYPDTTRGKIFAPAPGESFTERELSEISQLVKNMAFSRLGGKRRTDFAALSRALPARRAKASSK
jgi:hypothetical protein